MLRRVAVGMSGGVDSSVAALLLKQKGFDVHGVYMKNWDDKEESGWCEGARDAEDAEWVCKKLEIPFHQVNFVKEFWNSVFSDLLKEYSEGWTPNPDLLCNKHIKFDCFQRFALTQLGADAVATGHYADNSLGHLLQHFSPGKSARILMPKDLVKDQTFHLSQVDGEALKRAMFPLAHMLKSEVKQVADEAGLSKIVAKNESMGICFIGSRNFSKFIDQYIDERLGNFIDITSLEKVGEHYGIHHYTLGQNCRIAGHKHAYYVVSKTNSADILVAPGTHHPSLYTDLFFTLEPHWINKEVDRELNKGVLQCQFKFQNTHRIIDCTVGKSISSLVVRVSTNIRALTPGQFAVFYKDGECLGSARIRATGPSLFLQGRNFDKAVASTDQDLLSTALRL